MKKLLFAVLVLVLAELLLLSVSPAKAYDMTRKIIIADHLVFIPRVGASGYSAQARADLVNDRIAAIIGQEKLNSGNIYLIRTGGSEAIMVGHSLLFTVTPEDARGNLTNVHALAHDWLRNLRVAFPQSRPLPL